MNLRGNEYDGSIHKYPIKQGEVWCLENGSCVAIGDITKGIHDFMCQADCVFIDPPCSKGNLKSFYTKADVPYFDGDYVEFAQHIFNAIDRISPKIVFVEVFRSNKEIIARELAKRYKFIHENNCTYYHNSKNTCWILQASNSKKVYDLEGIDEWNAVFEICKSVPFQCIGDFCIGRGLVAMAACKYGKKFVGQELNDKRLAVCISEIAKKGGKWSISNGNR